MAEKKGMTVPASIERGKTSLAQGKVIRLRIN